MHTYIIVEGYCVAFFVGILSLLCMKQHLPIVIRVRANLKKKHRIFRYKASHLRRPLLQSCGDGAGLFGWSRSRRNYEVSAPARAPGEL